MDFDPNLPAGTFQYHETRVVDSQTGGAKGSKLARFDLIPPEAMWELAELYGVGCVKYADRNWEKGYKWSLSVAALQRHFHQWLMGESYDAETKKHHLISVMWHAIALFIYEIRKLGTDDVRRKKCTGHTVPTADSPPTVLISANPSAPPPLTIRSVDYSV